MRQHLLQSPEWETYEKSEGQKTFRVTGEGFSALAVLKKTMLGNYLYCPYGPTIESQNAEECKKNFKQALEALKGLAKEQGAFFVRVEPTFDVMSEEELKTLGLEKSHDIDPAHTWILDLAKLSREELLAGIEKRKLRHWRTHENKGIRLRQTQDPEQITILMRFLKGLGARDHFNPQNEEHLKRQLEAGFATLYVAELENEPIAAALIYDHDGVRYYAHAATDEERRKLMAGTIILIQMIVDAKEKGARVFDFWGITTSEDPKHPWYGFTQYKKSFGGEQVDYAGTWDLPVKKVRYNLYKVVRKINRAKRKLKRH